LGKYLSKKILDPSKVKLVQIFKNSKGLYCKLSYVEEIPDINVENPTRIVGLDVNAKRMVLSNNIFYNIKRLYHRKLENWKNNYQKHNLQNYTKDFLHKLTTQIAEELSTQGVEVLVLENLKNLRKSASRKLGTSKGRKLNYIINSMSFGMFQNFLKYKCLDRGIKVEFIQPAYTSKTCSRCKSLKTLRPAQDKFVCQDCGFQLNADLNGSRNIENFYRKLNGLPMTITHGWT
jgi:putative transposase